MCTNLLVIGASSRSFAESACRAGMTVSAIDLFGDRDLVAVCQQSLRLPRDEYPHGFLQAAAQLPPGPWVYGGGLENHPHLLDQLAAVRPLAGNTGRQTVLVRDPDRLAVLAKRAGFQFPATFRTPSGVPADGSYLLKPLASAGGLGVMAWRGGLTTGGRGDACWQQQMSGQVMSASLLLGPRQGELLGFCRQLIGHRWGSGIPFGFCGAVEQPLQLYADKVRDRFHRLAHLLADELGLRGLVGVDFILPRMGHGETPVVLEINPRPTASMELIDRRLGGSLAAWHVTACGLRLAGPLTGQSAYPKSVVWAKLILMSQQPVTITAAKDSLLDASLAATRAADEGCWPLLADRPCWGSRIERRRPIMTVFAAAASPAVALSRLRSRAEIVRSVLQAERNRRWKPGDQRTG